ncbi:MAG: hypothetical protein Q8M05_13000 [Rhodoferax sp.]|uniref:hypothetical protein n=1 Tax=Rhodoferax sp. TaxID=50421 RepID=UPI00273211C2|nr:hypothetical protein [Rhodoferax sp.]MDP1530292.1 hypothetical protein [Rhodoferax sp.]MDP1943361.1 hypothetical protein [Rhodoferax sp.]
MSTARKPQFCDLALIVRDVLAARHEPNYVVQKVMEMERMSPPEVLAWAVVYLDVKNQRALAHALGLNGSVMLDLRQVFDVVRHARPLTKVAL